MSHQKTTLQRTVEFAYGQPLEQVLRWALREAGERLKAARLLGIDRHTFNRWCQQHNVDASVEIAQAVLDTKRSA